MENITRIVDEMIQKYDRKEIMEREITKACEFAAVEILSDSNLVPFDRVRDANFNKIAAIIYKHVKGLTEL